MFIHAAVMAKAAEVAAKRADWWVEFEMSKCGTDWVRMDENGRFLLDHTYRHQPDRTKLHSENNLPDPLSEPPKDGTRVYTINYMKSSWVEDFTYDQFYHKGLLDCGLIWSSEEAAGNFAQGITDAMVTS